MSEAAPDSLMQMLTDQSESWNRGQPISVEEFAQRHPSLGDEQLLDLISNEIFIRGGRSNPPGIAEYRQRFPRFAEQIELQFQLHRAVGANAVPGFTRIPVALPALNAPSSAFLPSIPGYEVAEEIGRGGMGIVYKALQISLRRVVALKVLPMSGKNRAILQARFRVEAESVARLQNTNIVQIFEIGESETSSFFSLELVGGGNLAERLKTAAMSETEAAHCVKTLANAIHYAHRRGVIHRDLKPANILFTKDGTPKITDFGLAKRLTSNSRLTQFGDILGTPSYMAPEQALGNRPVDEAADIYSLGAILYELLTGQPPFLGETAQATLLLVNTAMPVPPVELRPTISRDLNAICMKCLEKNTADRYATAAAFARDLERFLQRRTVLARPVGIGTQLGKWVRRSPARAVLIAGVVLVGFAFLGEAVYHGGRLQKERARNEKGTHALSESVEAVRAERSEIEADRDAARETARSLERQRDAAILELRKIEAERDAARLADREAAHLVVGEAEKKRQEVLLRLERLRRELYAQQLLEAAALWQLDPFKAREALSNESRCPVDLRDFTWGLLSRCCDPPRTVLKGHSNTVTSIHAPSDGRTLASAGADGSVRLWNAELGLETHSLVGHRGRVLAVAFSPNGKLLATAGSDHSVLIWDAAGKLQHTLTGHKKKINALAFASNGRVVASAGEEGVIRLWDTAAGKELADFTAHQGAIHALAFTPDGKTLVSAGNDFVIKFWDEKKHSLIGYFNGHSGQVNALAFSPDGKWLASGSADGSARVWDMATHTAKHILAGHKGRVNALAFSSDGKTLASGTENTMPTQDEPAGTVTFWDIENGRSLALFPSKLGVASVVFASDNKLAIASGNEIELLQAPWHPERATFRCSEKPISAFAIAPDGESFAAAGQDPSIRMFNSKSGVLLGTLKRHTGVVNALAYQPDGRILASGGADGMLHFWNPLNAEHLSSIEAHPGGVNYIAYSKDGKQLASGGCHRSVKLWDPTTGKTLATLAEHRDEVTSLVFSNDGRFLASASIDGGLLIWRTSDGTLLRTLQSKGDGIHSVVYLTDGSTIATGGKGGSLGLWDIATGKKNEILSGHRAPVWSLALSPDGKTLASAAGDKNVDSLRAHAEIRLWDPVTFQLRSSLTSHTKAVTALGFSANGRLLGSASLDLTAKMWEVK